MKRGSLGHCTFTELQSLSIRKIGAYSLFGQVLRTTGTRPSWIEVAWRIRTAPMRLNRQIFPVAMLPTLHRLSHCHNNIFKPHFISSRATTASRSSTRYIPKILPKILITQLTTPWSGTGERSPETKTRTGCQSHQHERRLGNPGGRKWSTLVLRQEPRRGSR